MIGSLMENLPSTLAGGIALVCLTTYPLFRSRTHLLAMQLGAGVSFAAHYLLLEIFAASVVNMLGCVQTGAALLSGRSKVLNRVGYALIPLMILAGLHFWAGAISALSVAAMGLIALGRMQQRQPILRSLMLAGCTFWVMHDYLSGAWIALAADIGSWIAGAIGLAALYVRIRIERRTPEEPGIGAIGTADADLAAAGS